MGSRRVLVRRTAAAIAGCASLAAVSGCGAEDFKNDARPPAPIEVSALVTDSAIEVGPQQVGGGVVNVTVSNQTDEATGLAFEGPTDAETQTVPPGGVLTAKLELDEGDYEVAATGESARSSMTKLAVGPERPSSQNELLLP